MECNIFEFIERRFGELEKENDVFLYQQAAPLQDNGIYHYADLYEDMLLNEAINKQKWIYRLL